MFPVEVYRSEFEDMLDPSASSAISKRRYEGMNTRTMEEAVGPRLQRPRAKVT